MKTIQIKAVKRADYGKKAAKSIRREGQVPCVLYGGSENVAFSVDAKSLKPLIYTPNSYIVELDIEGKVEKAVLREVQFHPVREEILHVDFYQVEENTPIVMEVPVALNGLAEGVRAGGKLQLVIRKLKAKGLYSQIPEKLNIDVTSLGLGKTIKVGDLSFEGVEIMNAKEAVVCAVKLTRAARGAAAAQ